MTLYIWRNTYNNEHIVHWQNSETQVETEEDTQDIITELLGSEGVNCESNDEDNKSVIHILAKFLSGEVRNVTYPWLNFALFLYYTEFIITRSHLWRNC